MNRKNEFKINMEEELIKKNQTDPAKIIKKYWPYLLGGAFLIVLASGLFLKYALTEKKDDQPADGSFNVTSTDSAVDYDGLTGRALDGVLVPPEQAELMPYAVMVEMHTEARPLSGIAKAGLVYEAPVEGGITRLMAVFDATTTVESIGPVRSARPYFVEWADALNAVYAHVGGSPESLNRIKGLLDLKNLDEFSQGQYFWRSKQRSAPHNTYTSQELLSKAAGVNEWTPAKFKVWSYEEPGSDVIKGDYRTIQIPYGGSYTMEWRYDEETDLYTRYQGGRVFKDADGAAVTAKNVAVILTEQRVLDEVGRLYIRTTGSGRAMLFSHGQQADAQWKRTAGEHISFETVDGLLMPLARGTTWIQVVTRADFMPKVDLSSEGVE